MLQNQLNQYWRKDEPFLTNIVIGTENWMCYYDLEYRNMSITYHHLTSPILKKHESKEPQQSNACRNES